MRLTVSLVLKMQLIRTFLRMVATGETQSAEAPAGLSLRGGLRIARPLPRRRLEGPEQVGH